MLAATAVAFVLFSLGIHSTAADAAVQGSLEGIAGTSDLHVVQLARQVRDLVRRLG